MPLPRTGLLRSYTTVWVARPGLTPPYDLGLIDLGEGATVFAHLRRLTPNRPLELPIPVAIALPDHSDGGPSFWFEPTDEPDNISR